MKNYLLLFFILIFGACDDKNVFEATPQIISFRFADVKTNELKIDESKKTIFISLPFNTNVSALIPKIEITQGATVIPASGLAQNFQKPVFYTLITKDGQKTIYKVVINLAVQPTPEITQIDKDSVEAGFDFALVGKNFGTFGLDVQTFLLDPSNNEIKVKNRLIDSTKINVSTDLATKPGVYNLKLKVKNKEIISTQKFWITYPSPQVTAVEKQFFTHLDSLWLTANYVDVSKHKIRLQLENNGNKLNLECVKAIGSKLCFVLPINMAVNAYSVHLHNQTLNKLSRETNFKVEVFDYSKPYINGIINPKNAYKKEETIDFKTLNFEKIDARFYKISLIGTDKTMIQNGIYDPVKKTLRLNLPNTLVKGNYRLEFALYNPTGNVNYAFKSDITLQIID
jgi:methionine-rich copper-binding protein CopC